MHSSYFTGCQVEHARKNRDNREATWILDPCLETECVPPAFGQIRELPASLTFPERQGDKGSITNRVQGNDAWTPTLASQIHPPKSLNRDWSHALTV
jgi:hypothetical protein